MQKSKSEETGSFTAMLQKVPLRILKKTWIKFTEFVNVYLFNRFVNEANFQNFQNQHNDKLENHYYIIVLPGALHLLKPCIALLPNHVNFF